MIDLQEEKSVYRSNFEQFEKGAPADPSWLAKTRRAAMKRFGELGFPTPRNEDWRFTNVAALAKYPFRPALPEADGLTAERLARAAVPVGTVSRLVFVNGHYAPGLSSVPPLTQGVIVAGLADVLREHPEWVEPHLAKYARHQDYAFTALNTAFVGDGAFICVPRGKAVTEPLELLFVTTTAGEGSVTHPRNLIVVGEQGRV